MPSPFRSVSSVDVFICSAETATLYLCDHELTHSTSNATDSMTPHRIKQQHTLCTTLTTYCGFPYNLPSLARNSPLSCLPSTFFFFFFNDTAPPEISPLPLHAALPI